MATAFQAPHIVERENREAALARQMESPDPVARWNARERALGVHAEEAARNLAAQAEKNARDFAAQMRFYEESDRRNNPYRPLPRGAKIAKD